MIFVHEDPEFHRLLAIVAREVHIAAPLIEKDYWVTHCLWALHETGLDTWFKGGTSLSKGFKLIHRFSEDLDLMVRHGSVVGLPPVGNWTSTNKGPVAERRAFYDALPSALAIPGVRVEQDESRHDKQARGADYLGYYPGVLLDELGPAMSPFIRFEIGRARVVPHVERALGSFVHDYLAAQGLLSEYAENRPSAVRCVHPLVTLFEKLDAMARRYGREVIEADSFVRHYEDAARIIQAADTLPAIETTPLELAKDMRDNKDIAALPSADEPALLLRDATKRAEVESAYDKIAPMFWEPRMTLDEARDVVVSWVSGLR